jgi:hypothetical protein
LENIRAGDLLEFADRIEADPDRLSDHEIDAAVLVYALRRAAAQLLPSYVILDGAEIDERLFIAVQNAAKSALGMVCYVDILRGCGQCPGLLGRRVKP